jgi:hypothetical protein
VASELTPASSPRSTAGSAHDYGTQGSLWADAQAMVASYQMPDTDGQDDTAGSVLGDALVLVVYAVGLALGLLVIVPANVWPLWLAVGVPAAGARGLLAGMSAVGRRRAIRVARPVLQEAAAPVLADLRSVEQTAQ